MEFLLVAIVDPHPSNKSCYPRKSHLITRSELDGNWDHLPNANHSCQDRRRLFNIDYIIYALLASIIIAVSMPSPPHPYMLTKRSLFVIVVSLVISMTLREG